MNARVLIVIRDGQDAGFLGNLARPRGGDIEFLLVLERGSQAKKRKLSRYFKGQKAPLGYISSFLDVSALAVYHLVESLKMALLLRPAVKVECLPDLIIDDVNEARFLLAIEAFKPTAILSCGTAIYTRSTISEISCPIFNIHASVLPHYRNVHSDFWAFMNGDYGRIGVTIFRISAGIDTGEILLQEAAGASQEMSLARIKVLNLKLAFRLAERFIEMCALGIPLRTRPQEPGGSYFPTPSFRDFMRYWLSRKR